jgi:putative ABC transport system permease protein
VTEAAPRLGVVAPLALRDLSHGWRSTVCLAVAVCAALIPLLLLFGLKAGLVNNLFETLRADPTVREIRLVRDAPVPEGLIEELRADPRAAFVLPRALYLASEVQLRGPAGRRAIDARLIPTAAGDPFLDGLPIPEGAGQAVLSDRAARGAGATVGDRVTIELRRRIDDRSGGLRHALEVIAILPDARMQGDALFVAPGMEWAVEAWKQGAPPGVLGGGAGVLPPPPDDRAVSNFRLFAADVRDVPALRDRLAGAGLVVETRASEVERVMLIEAVLGWLFLAVSALSAAGFLLTLGLHLAASVVEKARELSILRLLGLSRLEVGLMPALQGLAIALAGAAAACLLVLAAEPWVNHQVATAMVAALGDLAPPDGAASRLAGWHLMLALTGAGLAGALAGVAAGLRAGALEPAQGLRRD